MLEAEAGRPAHRLPGGMAGEYSCRFRQPIAAVFLMRHIAKVLDAVIGSDPIDVVDRLFRPLTVMEKPNYPCEAVGGVAKRELEIAVLVLDEGNRAVAVPEIHDAID